MKKLILTSTAFTGQVIILFGLDTKLLQIDLSGANLDEEQTTIMKSRVPVFYDAKTFRESFKSKSLTVIDEEFEVTFEMWFDEYGIARNKQRCLIEWNRLNKGDRVKAYFKVKEYLRYLQVNNRFKAEPDSYLKKRYFDNDWTK